MQPGHIPVAEEDCELVTFSPKGEKNKKTMELLLHSRETMKKE
jgi:hypothetical protein